MAVSTAASTRKRPARMRESIGEVRAKRGRAEGEGVAFNLFPAIAAAFPGIFDEIVVETTEAIGDNSQARAPLLKKPQRKGDPEPGALKAAKRTSYRRSKRTGGITSGRVEYKAIDANQGDPKHNYARAVESDTVRRTEHGGVRVPGQPFLVPALVDERPVFNRKLRDLEPRLRAKVGGLR